MTKTKSARSGTIGRHRFHGAVERFDVVAQFIARRFPDQRYVADVAGGQGMLTRILNKRHNFECEVIDPRGSPLKGVPSRPELFTPDMAAYYDLIVGLHPDEALRDVVHAAAIRPVVVVPCCNFWTSQERLGREELLEAITRHHKLRGGTVERQVLRFRGPHNHALILCPPTTSG
ncbi:MAG: hypothetical protein ACHQIG_08385 [Acidimicrobiia bacterium]